MGKLPLGAIGITAVLLLSGCGNSTDGSSAPNSQTTQGQANPTGPVAGKILGQPFEYEQARIEKGILTIRRGKEFFADLEAKLFLFEDGNLAGKQIIVTPDKPGRGPTPHVHLGIMKPGAKIPHHEIVTDGYELRLAFGQPAKLGIPFVLQFFSSAQHDTALEGVGIATFEDVKVTASGGVDLMSDSFDTLKHVGREFLKANYGIGADVIQSDFGVSFKTFDDSKPYPKTGFVGFIVGKGKHHTTYKLMLAKKSQGWYVAKQIEAHQIPDAHPVEITVDGLNARTIASGQAVKTAALRFEQDLNQEQLMSGVRTAWMQCYLNKDHNAASCDGTYGLAQGEGTVCQSKSYLLVNDGTWSVKQPIERSQKVDYQTGELVDKKRMFDLHCG